MVVVKEKEREWSNYYFYEYCIVTNSLNNNKQFDPSASYTQLLILCIILLSFLRSHNNYPFDKNLDDIINSLLKIQILQKKKRNYNPSYNETLVKTPLVPRNSFRKRSSFPPPDFPNRKPDYPARNRAAFDEAENAILQSITRDEGRRWSARMAKRRQRRIAVTDPLPAATFPRIEFGRESREPLIFAASNLATSDFQLRGIEEWNSGEGWDRLSCARPTSMNIYDEPTDRGGPRKVLCCASLFGGGGGGRGGRRKKKEKENDECSTVQRSLGEKRKKRGHRSWGHRNCLRWIAFVSEFFFLLTLDEEQNFACN